MEDTVFTSPTGDRTAISMQSSEPCEGLTICRYQSWGRTFFISYFKTLYVGPVRDQTDDLLLSRSVKLHYRKGCFHFASN